MSVLVLIFCSLSASALKLSQQDPEFDVENATYDEDCGNRNNYKCWKKGGHSLDNEKPKFSIIYLKPQTNALKTEDQKPCAGKPSRKNEFNVNFRGQPVCGECYEYSTAKEPDTVRYLKFTYLKGNKIEDHGEEKGCNAALPDLTTYAAGSGQTCQTVSRTGEGESGDQTMDFGLTLTHYNFPDCAGNKKGGF